MRRTSATIDENGNPIDVAEGYTYANNHIYIDANIGWTNGNEKFRVDLTGKNILNN